MQFKEDKKRFAELFTSFTGIKKDKVEDFLKNNEISNVFEHPASLKPTMKQLEKINALKEMQNIYSNLKHYQNEYFINSSTLAKDYFINYFNNEKSQEKFVAAFLNSNNKIIQTVEIFKGTINEAPIYPREVTKQALLYDASSVIVSHNHPGESLRASSADIEVTRKIYEALRTQNIKLVDHIIVGGKDAISLAEDGTFNSIDESRVREEKNHYKALGEKIEAGIATAEDIQKYNAIQEKQFKDTINAAQEHITEDMTKNMDLIR